MSGPRHTLYRATALLTALLLPVAGFAQQVPPAAVPPAAPAEAKSNPQPASAKPAKPIRTRDRRKAAKLFIEASKLFEQGQFELARLGYERAAALVPDNTNYALAAQVARSHEATALIQTAAKARTRGDAAAARAALQRARTLDPDNAQVAEHVDELADDTVSAHPKAPYEGASDDLGQAPHLQPKPGTQSFHLKLDRRQLIQRVYKTYGIDATTDQSVPAPVTRFDVDEATFDQATEALADVTNTFAVPLDSHRVVVARDTKQYRDQFQRQETETLYLPGMATAELTEISTIAKNVFGITQVSMSDGKDALTLRAPSTTLNSFNVTLKYLLDKPGQVMLDVQILQLARTNDRNTGAHVMQQVTAFNVAAEEQAILSQNSAAVQEIISSGLASADDPLAILGILIASGTVSSSLFSNGIAVFGGGLTYTGISPGSNSLSLALNSSSTRALENVRLRLSDGQDETLRNGMRYPISTATYTSSLSSTVAGLTSAGTSSSLASLLASSTSSGTTIPQVQYQDLGLTLKATPKVMRSGDVALTLDLKITTLAGSSLNDIPVLNNRSYSGVITLKEGHGALLLSELDIQETRALSGTPGLSEIPGLNNLTGKDVTKDTSTLIVVLTPHLLQGPEMAGRTRMFRIDRGTVAR